MAEAGAGAKRLSFGDVTNHGAGATVTAGTAKHLALVAAAAREPSAGALGAAAASVAARAEERFGKVLEVGREQGPTGGGAALGRLKGQFRSLKAEFQELDTKEAFLDALQEGRPDGTELGVLQVAREGACESATELRAAKTANAQLREELEDLICRVCDGHREHEEVRARLEAALGELRECDERRTALEAEYGAQGSDAAVIEVQLAELERREVETATEVGAYEAEAERRAGECRELEGRVARLEAEVEAAEEAAAEARERVTQGERLQESLAWADALGGVVEDISGLRLLERGDGLLKLGVRTYPAPPPNTWEYCRALEGLPPAEHVLTLRTEPGSERLAACELSPPGVPLTDVLVPILGAAQGVGSQSPLSEVVREVQARVAAHLTREALLKALAVSRPVRWGTASRLLRESHVSVSFPGGVEAILDVPLWWPDCGAGIQLVGVEGQAVEWARRKRIQEALEAKMPALRILSLARFAEEVEAAIKATP